MVGATGVIRGNRLIPTLNNSENFFDINDDVLKSYPKIWFSSDSHFMHANIIKYCNRPFDSVSQMDDALLSKWNEVVSTDDLVFYLGDFSMSKEAYTKILPQLNFKKMIFILGNHDRKNALGDIERFKHLTIGYNAKKYFLTHRPIDAHDEYPTICGHVHEKWKILKTGDKIREFSRVTNLTREMELKHNIINVGADVHNFYPISIDEVISSLDET